MQNNIEKNQEILSDKEKLQQVKNFIQEAQRFGVDYGDRNLTVGDKTLRMEGSLSDGGSNVNIYLEKNGKEIFAFNLEESSFLSEGQDRTTGVTMKIDGKTMSYSGNFYDEHGIYNNFHLLEGAKKYLKECKDIFNIKKLEREKEQEIQKNNQEFKPQFDNLKSEIE